MSDHKGDEADKFPIRELSARTQVNTVTIRAWERRYGLLKPERTAKGHRLYSEADVITIERIISLVARGVPLSKVKPLLNAEADIELDGSETSNWEDLINQFVLAICSFSSGKVEQLINDFFSNFPVNVCRERLMEPALNELLQRKDEKAAYTFAESELIRYAALRLAKVGNKQYRSAPIVLLCGMQTPIWRLAMAAMELADSGTSVLLMNCHVNVATAVKFTGAIEGSTTIFYQDGVWSDKESKMVGDALLSNEKLILCGTAPVLANMSMESRIFSSLESSLPRVQLDYTLG